MNSSPFRTTRYGDELGTFRGKLYPGALEAAGAVRAPMARSSVASLTTEPNEDSAGHRARAIVRRYAVANCLDGFATLTVRRHISVDRLKEWGRATLKRLQRRCERFPYVWVIETTRRPHIHCLAPRYIAEELIASWPHGHTDLAPTLGDVEQIRQKASYISKDFTTTMIRPRYNRGRGFAPEVIEVHADSAEQFLARSEHLIGHASQTAKLGQRSVSALWLPTK